MNRWVPQRLARTESPIGEAASRFPSRFFPEGEGARRGVMQQGEKASPKKQDRGGRPAKRGCIHYEALLLHEAQERESRDPVRWEGTIPIEDLPYRILRDSMEKRSPCQVGHSPGRTSPLKGEARPQRKGKVAEA
ncbi:MAG: hypothetical protein D6812_07615 [Deltaproteobacteria bacterium]|nr:MAG: hypothetical protein D6812_07615 [Deltaproteobacteria bacterium]